MTDTSVYDPLLDAASRLDNPYWALCEPLTAPDSFSGLRTVGGLRLRSDDPGRPWDPARGVEDHQRNWRNREEWVARYAWTITAPDTVAFLAAHSGGRLLDPLAGTGYWGHLLGQLGVDVLSYDLHPPRPGSGENRWHRDAAPFGLVMTGDAVDVTARHGHDRTLLLAWPPYSDPVGADILAAYTGPTVIYIGEGSGGCTGDDALHHALGWDRYDDATYQCLGPDPSAVWEAVDDHAPVQWYGLHDWVHVYTRRGPAAIGA